MQTGRRFPLRLVCEPRFSVLDLRSSTFKHVPPFLVVISTGPPHVFLRF